MTFRGLNAIFVNSSDRKRLHNKAKLINSDEAWSNFRKKRNEVTTAIRKSKAEYRVTG